MNRLTKEENKALTDKITDVHYDIGALTNFISILLTYIPDDELDEFVKRVDDEHDNVFWINEDDNINY